MNQQHRTRSFIITLENANYNFFLITHFYRRIMRFPKIDNNILRIYINFLKFVFACDYTIYANPPDANQLIDLVGKSFFNEV